MQVCTQAWRNVASIASGEALQAIDTADEHVLDAAAPEVVEDGQPELGALGVLPPHPQHLALAVAADAECEVPGAVLDRAVLADAHHHRVEVDDRIDLLQRPGPPRRDVLQDGIGDGRDGVAADLGAVDLRDVRAEMSRTVIPPA